MEQVRLLNTDIFALLSDRGSLTGRFEQVMGVKPRLTLLNQGRQMVSREERTKLGIPPREMALVREIKMGKHNKNWMFARTIVPNRTLQGPARRIASLNDTPIGKLLFGRNGAIRKSMEVNLTWELPQTLLAMGVIPEHQLWQRQSIFEFHSGPLMVTELFLPDCPIYLQDDV